jgi:hypothetical protein
MTTTCAHHKERGLRGPFWDSFPIEFCPCDPSYLTPEQRHMLTQIPCAGYFASRSTIRKNRAIQEILKSLFYIVDCKEKHYYSQHECSILERIFKVASTGICAMH